MFTPARFLRFLLALWIALGLFAPALAAPPAPQARIDPSSHGHACCQPGDKAAKKSEADRKPVAKTPANKAPPAKSASKSGCCNNGDCASPCNNGCSKAGMHSLFNLFIGNADCPSDQVADNFSSPDLPQAERPPLVL